MQFHHDGESHWLLSHSDGSEVFVYDSIYNRPNYMVKQQLCQCYSHLIRNDLLRINYAKVTKQKGSNDCGVLAIAYMVELLAGCSPCSITFDQSKIRHHLAKCIENDRLTQFPKLVSEDVSMVSSVAVQIEVCGGCKKPRLEGCDRCKLCQTN